jgi:hypothetical protein
MHKLEQIADDIRKSFDVRTKMRDEALALTRQLTRACSLAIRAVHRSAQEEMEEHLDEAHKLADTITRRSRKSSRLVLRGIHTRRAQGICGSQRHLRVDPKPDRFKRRRSWALKTNDLSQRAGGGGRRTAPPHDGYSPARGIPQEAERLLSVHGRNLFRAGDHGLPRRDHERSAPPNRPCARHHRKDARRRHLQPARRRPVASHPQVERAIERRSWTRPMQSKGLSIRLNEDD